VPGLDADAHELVAEEDGGVDAPAADGEADACEGLAVLEGDEEDVADLGGVGAGAVEEGGAGAGWVEAGDLLGCQGGDGVGEG
jgi:hypothetical protein